MEKGKSYIRKTPSIGEELDYQTQAFIQTVTAMVDFEKNSLYVVVDVETIYFILFGTSGLENIEACKIGELVNNEWIINTDTEENMSRTVNTLRLLTTEQKEEFPLETWTKYLGGNE